MSGRVRCRSSRPQRSQRGERGQASVIIVGFAVVVMMTIAVAVDASAAYLQRSGLSTLADGAALTAADLGATGADVYEGGVPDERLAQTPPQARAAVGRYLTATGAYGKYPGLRFDVVVDPVAQSVRVDLRAPLELPLSLPGAPRRTTVGATGEAVARVG